MSSKNCDTDEEEINDNVETSSSTANKTQSATSCKSRRSKKLSWIPSPEKETYRTVVVNYRYDKMNKNYPRNTGAVSKKKHLNRMVAKQNNDEEEEYDDDDEDEDVPSLCKLYDCSKEYLDTYKTPNKPVPSYENIRLSHKKPTKEAIKLPILPGVQEATVEEPQLNAIEESEFESATLRGDDYNDEDAKSHEYSDERIFEATDNSPDTTGMAISYPSCTDFVLLGDNRIGETPDFDADFCWGSVR